MMPSHHHHHHQQQQQQHHHRVQQQQQQQQHHLQHQHQQHQQQQRQTQAQQQQQQPHQPAQLALTPITTLLTPKPHAFSGAVLPPKHARELTPSLVLNVTAALADAASAAAPSSSSTNPSPPTSDAGVSSDPNHPNSRALWRQNHNHHHGNSNANATRHERNHALSMGGAGGGVQYTVWITEAWKILTWAEPSAALFWEMATMYHTLYVAGRSVEISRGVGGDDDEEGGGGDSAQVMGGGAGDHPAVGGMNIGSTIPPILSCGSTSSVDSKKGGSSSGPPSPSNNNSGSSQKSDRSNREGGNLLSSHNNTHKGSAASAKELPVWLVGTFLLLHMEEHAYVRNVSGEDERRFGVSSSSNGPMSVGGGHVGGAVGGNMKAFNVREGDMWPASVPHATDGPGVVADPLLAVTGVGGGAAAGVGGPNSGLSPRTRLHATTPAYDYRTTHASYCASFLAKHLRKLLLLCAVPHSVEARRALEQLVHLSRQQAKQRYRAAQQAQQRRAKGQQPPPDDGVDVLYDDTTNNSTIGLDVRLSPTDLERLNLILEPSQGGRMDDDPLDVAAVLLPAISGGGGGAGFITVGDAERQLRRHLETSVVDGGEGGGKAAGGGGADPTAVVPDDDPQLAGVSSALMGMRLDDSTPDPTGSVAQQQRPGMTKQGSLGAASHKELLYSGYRGTTVMLKPRFWTNEGGGLLAPPPPTPDLDRHQLTPPPPPPSSSSSSSSHQHHRDHHHHHQAIHRSLRTYDAAAAAVVNHHGGRLHDVTLVNCSDTHFYLLQPFEHATIAACTDCTIVLGAVAGLLHVLDCERCEISTASRRILVSNSLEVVNFCFTPSPPLLVGDNRSCQFAPYNTYYEGLRDDLLATGLAAVLPAAAGGSAGGAANPVATTTTTADGLLKITPLQCASNKWKLPVELAKLEIPQLSSSVGGPAAATGTSASPPATASSSPVGGGNAASPSSSSTSPSSSSSSPDGGGGDSKNNNSNNNSGTDDTMHTPVLLPASEFHVLFVPLESEAQRWRRMQQAALQQQQLEAAAAASAEEDGGGNAPPSSSSSSDGDPSGGGGGGLLEESQYCRNLADILQLSPFRLPVEYERRVHVGAERVRTLHQAMQSDLTHEQQLGLEEELNRGFRDWLVTSGNLRQVLDLVHMERGAV